MTSIQAREILRASGTLQFGTPDRPVTERIGNRPNLAEIVGVLGDEISTGVASQYWDETVAYPPGSISKLWLFVDGSWKQLENASQGAKDLVQRAFLGSGSFVRVWYKDSTVVALVVEGSHASG